MNDQERAEIIASLNTQAELAHTLAALYEAAAETVAGFRSEEEYESFAREAFETRQQQIDDDLSCRYDAEIEDARESVR